MEKHDKADVKADKKMIASPVHKHEKRMHKGMAKGGVTGEAMRKYGRNLARAMNQRGSSRGG